MSSNINFRIKVNNSQTKKKIVASVPNQKSQSRNSKDGGIIEYYNTNLQPPSHPSQLNSISMNSLNNVNNYSNIKTDLNYVNNYYNNGIELKKSKINSQGDISSVENISVKSGNYDYSTTQNNNQKVFPSIIPQNQGNQNLLYYESNMNEQFQGNYLAPTHTHSQHVGYMNMTNSSLGKINSGKSNKISNSYNFNSSIPIPMTQNYTTTSLNKPQYNIENSTNMANNIGVFTQPMKVIRINSNQKSNTNQSQTQKKRQSQLNKNSTNAHCNSNNSTLNANQKQKPPFNNNTNLGQSHSNFRSNTPEFQNQQVNSTGSYLKNMVELREQNIKLNLDKNNLKAEITRIEKELQNKEKILQELIIATENSNISNNQENNLFDTISKTKDVLLIDSLKKQYKELQLRFKQKDEELERLKRNTKVSRITELNEEVKVLSNELQRLRDINITLSANNSNLLKEMKELEYRFLLEEEKNQALVSQINELNELKNKERLNENVNNNSYNDAKLNQHFIKMQEIINERDYYIGLNNEKSKKLAQIEEENKNFIQKIEEYEETISKLNQLQDEKREIENELNKDEAKQETSPLKENDENHKESVENEAENKKYLISTQPKSITLEEIEEIGYLIFKIYQGMDITKKELEKLLFDNFENSDFKSELFYEKFTQRLLESLKVNQKNQREIDTLCSFTYGCIENYSKVFEYFKLKFMLMFDLNNSKKLIEETESERLLKQKIKEKISSIKTKLRNLSYTKIISFSKFKYMLNSLSQEKMLTEKELEYLITQMKIGEVVDLSKENKDEASNLIFSLNFSFISDLIQLYEFNQFREFTPINSSYKMNNNNYTTRENPKKINKTFSCFNSFNEFLAYYELPSKTKENEDNEVIYNEIFLSLPFIESLILYLQSTIFSLELLFLLNQEIVEIKTKNSVSVKMIHLNSLVKLLFEREIISEIKKHDLDFLVQFLEVNIFSFKGYLNLNLIESLLEKRKLRTQKDLENENQLVFNLADLLIKAHIKDFEYVIFILQKDCSYNKNKNQIFISNKIFASFLLETIKEITFYSGSSASLLINYLSRNSRKVEKVDSNKENVERLILPFSNYLNENNINLSLLKTKVNSLIEVVERKESLNLLPIENDAEVNNEEMQVKESKGIVESNSNFCCNCSVTIQKQSPKINKSDNFNFSLFSFKVKTDKKNSAFQKQITMLDIPNKDEEKKISINKPAPTLPSKNYLESNFRGSFENEDVVEEENENEFNVFSQLHSKQNLLKFDFDPTTYDIPTVEMLMKLKSNEHKPISSKLSVDISEKIADKNKFASTSSIASIKSYKKQVTSDFNIGNKMKKEKRQIEKEKEKIKSFIDEVFEYSEKKVANENVMRNLYNNENRGSAVFNFVPKNMFSVANSQNEHEKSDFANSLCNIEETEERNNCFNDSLENANIYFHEGNEVNSNSNTMNVNVNNTNDFNYIETRHGNSHAHANHGYIISDESLREKSKRSLNSRKSFSSRRNEEVFTDSTRKKQIKTLSVDFTSQVLGLAANHSQIDYLNIIQHTDLTPFVPTYVKGKSNKGSSFRINSISSNKLKKTNTVSSETADPTVNALLDNRKRIVNDMPILHEKEEEEKKNVIINYSIKQQATEFIDDILGFNFDFSKK